jgi:hypothetical protein
MGANRQKIANAVEMAMEAIAFGAAEVLDPPETPRLPMA